MRWLLRTLLALGALAAFALLAAGIAIWALGSEQGTAWLLGQAQARSNGAITIARVHGSLLQGVTLERVELRFGRDEIDIDTVSLTWVVPAALGGTLAFENVSAGRVEYRQLPGPDEPAADGSTNLDLPFAIEARDVLVDSVAVTAGTQTLEFGRTTAAARFADAVLNVTNAATQTRGFALTGALDAALTEPLRLAVALDWTQLGSEPPLAGRLTLAGDWPELDFEHALTAPVALLAAGSVSLDGTPTGAVDLQWDAVAWPGFDLITSTGGNLAIEGSLEDYRFTGTAQANVAGASGQVDVRGSGGTAALVLETLSFTGERGTLSAAGEVALDTRTAALDLAAAGVDPSWLLAGWPGQLDGRARLDAALTPLVLAFDAVDVRGTLRDQPVAATGALEYAEPDRVRLAALRVESGANAVSVDGELGLGADSPLALTVDAQLAALGAFVPDARGSLTAQLSLAGTRAAPRVTGNVAAERLEALGYAAASVSVAGSAGLMPEDAVDVAIEAAGVRGGPIEIDAVGITVDGTSARHRVAFEAGSDRWQSTLEASGGWSGDRWRGAVDALALDQPALGRWALADSAAVELGASSAVLETLCLAHGSGGRWCVELSLRRAADDRLVIAAQNFDLATLQPLLPPELTLSGVYQLSASFADLTTELRGSVAVSGGPTEVEAAFNEQQSFTTVLEGVTVGATLENSAFALAANVRARDSDGRLSLETRVADVRAEDSPISGRFDLYWPDLAFLRLVTPDVGDIAGAIAANLTLAGSIEEPELQGGAQWTDGRVAVPQWGLVIDRMSAQATSRDGSALDFRASGWVDDAELALTGSTALDPDAGYPTRLELRGDSVRAVQLPDIEIFVSPDLRVEAQLPRVHATGTVHVPRARIELSALPPAAIAPSPDAIVHGTEEAREVRTLQLTTDILVTLGDAVQYSGLNLATTVSGELRLRRDASRTTVATGALMLEGNYSAYGQTLDLERGQLIFNGPLGDPALDVRAVRTIEDVRAGIELLGTVQAPRTRVFSEPAMNEADALSYLLLGRPVTGAGGGEDTATLQTAALAMGLQQALPVVQRIGQTLGLDELTVQTTDTDAGALMAGKYLSPKVFIRYSYGLFNRIGGLLLRFRVNERLSIETRSGDQQSMDLLYTVEKD